MYAVAEDLSSHGCTLIPLWPRSKKPTSKYGLWFTTPQMPAEREAMFPSNYRGNIGVLCGQPSGNLVALDAETPEIFAQLLVGLSELGIVTWTVRSKRGGHVWVRTDKTIYSHTPIRPLEVRSQGKYVAAPPSRHPTGIRYAWHYRPASGIACIDVDTLAQLVNRPLVARGTPPITPEYLLSDQPIAGTAQLGSNGRLPGIPPAASIEDIINAMSPDARGLLLADRATVEKWVRKRVEARRLRAAAGKRAEDELDRDSRSEMTQSLLCSMALAGADFEQALAMFTKFPTDGRFQEMEREQSGKGLRWLQRSWATAIAWLTQHSETPRAWQLHSWALATPWPGRTGAYDQAVFVAHMRCMAHQGRQPWSASVRTLAEMAACSRPCAMRANVRLQANHLITLAQHATLTGAAMYRLGEGIPDSGGACGGVDSLTTPHCGATHMKNGQIIDMRLRTCMDDAFRRRALGQSGYAVLAALRQGPATIAGLSRATGRARSTVKAKLERLCKAGIVEPVGDDLWETVAGVDMAEALDYIAQKHGTAGAGERQRAIHAAERAARPASCRPAHA